MSSTTASPTGRIALTPDVAAGAIILAGMVFFLATLRPGQDWGDDFAMYVLHASNIVAGVPYGATGYIANPWNVPGPPTYPPVYPLILAPIVGVWGLDYEPMKALGVLFLGLALTAIYGLFRPLLRRWESVVLVAVLAFNPYLWVFKDEVRPDLAFLFLVYATLLAARSTLAAEVLRRRLAWGVVLGLLAYLAYGTRSIGLVVLPAIVAAELIERRRIGPGTVAALAVFAVLAAAQNVQLHSDRVYTHLVTLDPSVVGYNLAMYLRSFAILWTNGVSEALRAAVFLVVTLFAVVGYVVRVRQRITVLEVLPWFYFAPLAVQFVGTLIQQRYVLPLLPLYLFFAIVGMRAVLAGRSPSLRRAVVACLAAVVVGQYAVRYAAVDTGPIREGPTAPHAQAAFRWLRDHVDPSETIVVGKARAVALYTGRRAASAYGYRTDGEIAGLLREVNARYVIIARGALAEEMDFERPKDLPSFVDRHPREMTRMATFGDLEVYRVDSLEFPS